MLRSAIDVWAPYIWTFGSSLGFFLSFRLWRATSQDVRALRRNSGTKTDTLEAARHLGRMAISRMILLMLFTIVGILSFGNPGGDTSYMFTLLTLLITPLVMSWAAYDSLRYRTKVHERRDERARKRSGS